jgi:hypothetical protein
MVMLCVMGPIVPWEWAWYLLRRRPGKAFRRLSLHGLQWKGLTIHYPSTRTLSSCFQPWFRLERASAVGALIPPSYTEEWAVKHLSAVQKLGRWERRLETMWPLPQLADHYLVELQRVETA